MQERKINLEEILNKYVNSIVEDITDLGTINVLLEGTQVPDIILAMKETARQTLELAAENANVRLETTITNHKDPPYMRRKQNVIVDKQSILDTINQIE